MEVNEKIDLEKLIDKIQDNRLRFYHKNEFEANTIILDYRLKRLFETEGSKYIWESCYTIDMKDKILGLDFITVSEKDYIGVGFVERLY